MPRRSPATAFAVLTALRWFPIGLVVPVTVLLMQARGLSLAQAGQLMASYSLVAVLLELPTGGFADAFGRRPVLASASVLGAAGSVVLAVAPSMTMMTGAMILLGASRALGSGPLEAWYVDTVRAGDPTAPIHAGLGHAQAAEGLALAVGSMIGGLLPSAASRALGADAFGGGLLVPLSVPFLVSAGLLVVHAAAVVAFVTEAPPARSARTAPASMDGQVGQVGQAGQSEPGRRGPSEAAGSPPASRASVGGTVRDALRLVGGSSDLLRLMGYAAILGIALAGVELISPAALGSLLGGPDQAGGVYGILVGLAFGASAAGAVLSPRLARRFSEPRRAAIVLATVIAPVCLLVAVPALAVASVGFLAFYLVLGTNGPVLARLLHDRVPSAQRSTVLSVQSLALQFGGVVSSLGVGALVAAAGLPAGYVLIALALLVGAVLLRGLSGAPDDPARSGQGSGSVIRPADV